MAVLSSDHLKSVVFNTNVYENKEPLRRYQGATVQSYEYESMRSRDAVGIPYGNCHTTLLTLRLKNYDESIAKFYLNAMRKTSPEEISLLFNVTFDQYGEIKEYEDSFVARGYVVETEEMFASDNKNDSMKQLQIKMLLSRITYGEETSASVLIMSND
ncbi:MAG: hypothetical protein J1F67_06650 [Muribaculaceae bacterium]|nr:hypothetical protein [Muribaculaceae bacterium]